MIFINNFISYDIVIIYFHLIEYPRPLSVDSMDMDPSWTPLHRLNRVDCRDVTCPHCRPHDFLPYIVIINKKKKKEIQTATFKTTTEIQGVMSQMSFWGLCPHGVLSAVVFRIAGFFVLDLFTPLGYKRSGSWCICAIVDVGQSHKFEEGESPLDHLNQAAYNLATAIKFSRQAAPPAPPAGQGARGAVLRRGHVWLEEGCEWSGLFKSMRAVGWYTCQQ